MHLQYVRRLQAEAQSQRTVRREEWQVSTIVIFFPSTGLCAAPAKQSVLSWIAVVTNRELQLKELLAI